MATGKALNGKPYAGNPHVRFDEGEVAPVATPRRGSLLYKKNVIRVAVTAFLMCAAGTARAVPTDGGEWAIGAGETETLDAAATISRLAVDGSLTLGAGAALTANGAVVNCISTGDGMVADMTIASGASFASQGNLTGANPGNTQGFSIGTYGGTGTVTVASGGTLTVTGGRLFLGRNSLTDANGADRTKLSHGVLNIFGTVTAPTIACGAWFPEPASGTTYDLDVLPVASIINLEEGGVLETGRFQSGDACRNVINFKGGTLRLTREENQLVYASVSTIWNIEAGKSLVFDSQSYNTDLNPTLPQPDSFKITGAGGLVKKGTGYLRICMSHPEMNTFTGPIVVEEGCLSIGRPLAEGQTVLVKRGAKFDPAGAADLAKITCEDSADVVVNGTGTFVVGADGQDCTLGVDVEGATVMKVGAGTLTLSDNFNGKLVVKEGTAIVRGIAYKSYRFQVEEVRGPSPDAMQLSELKLLDGAADVTRPYSGLGYDTDGAVADRIYPAAECPTNLVDGNLSTKWLDWRLLSSHPESDHDRVWLRIDCPSLRPITGYAWYTANDHNERDPSAWRLQGSNDGGATWTDIDVRTGFAATSDRMALAGTFAGFGALGSSARVVVESGATLRVIGGAIPATAIHDVGGTVELAEGAELVSDGGAINGGASGTGSVNVVGGNVSLRGQQSYTGVTHVGSGTLNIGIATNPAERASFSGKYFRLTIKRASNNGASVAYKKSGSNTPSDGGFTQASEFRLYDADGNNVALGLTKAADGTAATALAAGTFATAAAYTYGVAAEGAEKLFDGDTSTKCNMTTPINRNDPSTWRVITMRLADGAAPVVSYNFYTAKDLVRRSPTDWQLEGSMDGIAWETLDERFFAPNAAWGTASSSTASNESNLQYKPFNNGTPFRLQETMRQPSTGGKYFRFTFKKTVGNTILQLSEIQLLDADGNNVARGLTKAANGTAATALSAGSFADGGSYEYGNNGNEGSDKLFDDNPDTKMCAKNNDMAGAAANYRVFTLRLADEAAPVCGYNFVTANDSLNTRSPSDWLVEGSEDGVTWTPLDEHANESAPFSVYAAINHGRPYTFSQIFESGSIPADSVVTVDAGATLNLNDANATIGKLRVDCAAGAGTINSFRPAAGGTLELVNVPEGVSLKSYVVPITVTDVQNAANLRSWTVTVNGAHRGVKATYRDGGIALLYGGVYIIVR